VGTTSDDRYFVFQPHFRPLGLMVVNMMHQYPPQDHRALQVRARGSATSRKTAREEA